MVVLCGWKSPDGKRGILGVESEGFATLYYDFANRAANECEKWDRDRKSFGEPPSWTRPTDAEIVWYLPENGKRYY